MALEKLKQKEEELQYQLQMIYAQADPDYGQIGKSFKLKHVSLEDTQNAWLKIKRF